MCRLYGLHASHPTTPSCELIDAQNSLLGQSIRDARGLANVDGWGMGHVLPDGSLDCERQTDPAHESEAYRRRASSIESITVVAHVRRATVGAPGIVNTHPFRDDEALLVHNGHVDAFDRVRPRMLEAMGEERAGSIRGETDSEHVFALLMSRLTSDPGERPPEATAEVLAHTVRDIRRWTEEEGGTEVTLNVIWAVGEEIVGSRFGRDLHVVERSEAYECPVCGHHHGPPDAEDYRAVVVASERITDEAWKEVEDGSVWWIDEVFRFRSRPID